MVAKTTMILYSDFSDVTLKEDGKNEYIYLLTNNGENLKIDIKASLEETQKMFNFIIGYKVTGIELINEKLLNDKDFAWKIEAIRNQKNLKIAEIEQRSIQNRAKIHENHKENKTEVHEKYQESIADIHEKYQEISKENQEAIGDIHEKYQKVHQRNHDKINQVASARSHYQHSLNYCGGIADGNVSNPTKFTVNSIDQIVEIEPLNSSKFNIPFSDIKGAYVTTDVEIPPADMKSEYTFYLHIKYLHNGQDSELVFSHRQKQNCTVDPIEQLNYAMQHIGEKIEWKDNRDAKYDQREQQLLQEREVLLSQRSSQINHMHDLLNPNAGTIINTQTQNAIEPPVTTAISPSSSNTADELRKFKSLLDDGIITQDEFDAKKKQLLNL